MLASCGLIAAVTPIQHLTEAAVILLHLNLMLSFCLGGAGYFTSIWSDLFPDCGLNAASVAFTDNVFIYYCNMNMF